MISPLGLEDPSHWYDIIQVLPLFLMSFLIGEITWQRQRHHLELQSTSNALRQYAQELETLNTSLQALNQTKDRQLAMAAHELKTPLTTLRLYAQYLQRFSASSPPKSATLTDACQGIEEQTQRMTALIQEILSEQFLSSSQEAMVSSQSHDLRALSHRIVEHQRFLTHRSLHLSTSSTALRVFVSPHHFEQILNNLISNAVKYSPEKSCVEVDLCRRENMACVSIHNAGPGIAPDQIPLLFLPGYRTPEAQASSILGHGLGLALVQTLVSRYHGQVWCGSTSEEGTTFLVELPLAQEE